MCTECPCTPTFLPGGPHGPCGHPHRDPLHPGLGDGALWPLWVPERHTGVPRMFLSPACGARGGLGALPSLWIQIPGTRSGSPARALPEPLGMGAGTPRKGPQDLLESRVTAAAPSVSRRPSWRAPAPMPAEREVGRAGAPARARVGEERAPRGTGLSCPRFLPDAPKLLALKPHPQPGAGSRVSGLSPTAACAEKLTPAESPRTCRGGRAGGRASWTRSLAGGLGRWGPKCAHGSG